MVKFIESELLLRIFLDCYNSLSAMPIKFPASLSQMTTVKCTYEQKGLKNPYYANIYSSNIISGFMTSAISVFI